MIRGMMIEDCIHLLRSDKPDVHGEFEYTPQSPELRCWFVDQEGRIVRDAAGQDAAISGELYLVKEISIDDKVVYHGYEYAVVTKIPLKSSLTGEVLCWKYRVARRRPYNEKQVKIG